MRTLRVKPLGPGWVMESDVAGLPLVFRAGAEAERSAKGLARVLATLGEQAQVVVHDRRGVVIGSLVF
jgi:hypothetical protein